MKAVSRLTSFAGYGAKALFRGAGMALSLTVLFIGSDCFGRGMGTNELAALGRQWRFRRWLRWWNDSIFQLRKEVRRL